MSEANNKVRSAVKIFDFGNGVRFLYPLNYIKSRAFATAFYEFLAPSM